MTGIKRSVTKAALVVSAAVISAVGPCSQLNAFAYDFADGEVIIKATGATASEGTLGTTNFTWTIAGEEVTLGAASGVPVVNGDGGEKIISYKSGIGDLKGGLSLWNYDGGFCSKYEAVIDAPSAQWNTPLACYDGNGSSEITVADDTNFPGNVDTFILTVRPKTVPQFFSAVFDNVKQYDETEGKYVIVSAGGDNFPGKEFKLTSSMFIGGKGDDSGTIYSVDTLDEDAYRHLTITISGEDFDANTMALFLHGPNGYEEKTTCAASGNDCVVEFSDYNLPDSVNIDILPKDGDGPAPHPGDPTNATVTVHSSNGSSAPKSFYKGRISINDTGVFEDDKCELNESDPSCTNTYTRDITYNKEASATTVEVRFSPLFIYKVSGPIIINGGSYNIPFDYSKRAEWLAHYSQQEVSFELTDVPYNANGYDIELNVVDAGEDVFIGNFLWSNDPKDEGNDDYIGHARVEMVSLLCHIDEGNDVLITPETENIPDGCVVEFEQRDNNTVGSLVVPDGSVATIKIWTEYGWQVTSFGINSQNVDVDPDKIAEYTFTISKGNYHLGAVVEQTEDEVNAESEKVKAGSIELGDGEINEGTAMLTVSDADLTEEERERFQNEAGDYKVSTYLNIDLDQIFYDGHGDYWKGAEMKELDNEATITLQLEDGIDGNSVVIVHQKHDGTYEIIPTTYDPATHTLTFKTSSFSNYAIASKTVVTPDSPNTGDMIMQYVAVFFASVSVLAIVGFAIYKSKKEA